MMGARPRRARPRLRHRGGAAARGRCGAIAALGAARGRTRAGVRDRHRRHEGRRARRARTGVFVNTVGHRRSCAPGIAPAADRAPAGRRRHPLGRRSGATASPSCRSARGSSSRSRSSPTRQPLHGLVDAMLAACPAIHCPARPDPRRAGVRAQRDRAGVAASASVLDEPAIPIPAPVRAACEILGLDPLHVANEGKLVAIVPAASVDAVLAAMRACRRVDAAVIGGRRRRPPGHGHGPHDRRLGADRGHARRGAAAPDLLSGRPTDRPMRPAGAGPRSRARGRAPRAARRG